VPLPFPVSAIYLEAVVESWDAADAAAEEHGEEGERNKVAIRIYG